MARRTQRLTERLTRRVTLTMSAAVAAMSLRDRVRSNELISFLIARVGAERFALELSTVQEAVDLAALDRVPQVPAGAIGLLTWRGVAHTVWSPSAVLHVPLAEPDMALFIRATPLAVGIAVDDVEDLVTVPGGAIRAFALADEGDRLVVGVMHGDDSLVTVLDADVLVTALRDAGGREAA